MTGWGDSECGARSLQYLGLFHMWWDYTTWWPISKSWVQLLAGGQGLIGGMEQLECYPPSQREAILCCAILKDWNPSPRAWLKSIEKLTKLPHTPWAFSSHPEPSTPLVLSTSGHPSSPSVFSCAYSPKPSLSKILRVNNYSSWVHCPRGAGTIIMSFNGAVKHFGCRKMDFKLRKNGLRKLLCHWNHLRIGIPLHHEQGC